MRRAVDREWIRVNYSGQWPLRLHVFPAIPIVVLLPGAAAVSSVSRGLADAAVFAGVIGSLALACWIQWRWYIGGPASSLPRRQQAWRRRADRLARREDKGAR